MNQRRAEENEREKTRMKPEDEAISNLAAQYEVLMENGELDEASKVEAQLQEIKAKRAAAAAAAESAQGLNTESSAVVGQMLASLGNHPQYQALRVCDQCGLLLSAKEDTKLDDHFVGKLHSGYVQIREKLGEVERILEADREGEQKETHNGRHHDPDEIQPYKPSTSNSESAAPSTEATSTGETTEAVTSTQPTTGVSESSKEEIKPDSATADSEAPSSTATTEKTSEGEDVKKVEATGENKDGKSESEENGNTGQVEDSSAKVIVNEPLTKRKKRTRASEGYETELPEPPSRQRDRERPRYGDARDRDYDRDRDRERYSHKDRFRGRRGGGGGGYRGGDHHEDRRGGGGYRDRDRDHHHGGNASYRDRDSDRYRDSYRDRY